MVPASPTSAASVCTCPEPPITYGGTQVAAETNCLYAKSKTFNAPKVTIITVWLNQKTLFIGFLSIVQMVRFDAASIAKRWMVKHVPCPSFTMVSCTKVVPRATISTTGRGAPPTQTPSGSTTAQTNGATARLSAPNCTLWLRRSRKRKDDTTIPYVTCYYVGWSISQNGRGGATVVPFVIRIFLFHS